MRNVAAQKRDPNQQVRQPIQIHARPAPKALKTDFARMELTMRLASSKDSGAIKTKTRNQRKFSNNPIELKF